MAAGYANADGAAAGGGLTDAELRATPVPVSGTVTVTDGAGPLTVDGTVATNSERAEDSAHASGQIGNFVLAVRNDAGTSLVDTTLDYAPLQVNSVGELRVTTSGGTPSGRDDTDNQAAVTTGLNTNVVRPYVWDGATWDRWTGAVTGPLTDAQLRATPVPISGTVTVTDGAGPLTVDGTVEIGATSLAALESITVQNGAGAAAVNIQDGGNSITVDGPLTDAQLRATPVPVSGTVTITDGAGPVTVDGTVAATQSGAWTVDTEMTVLDYDSGAGTVNAAVTGVIVPAAGGPAAVPGDTTNGLDVDVTRVQGTVTVGGTVTANQGTANTAANAWMTKLTDGTNVTAVKAASTAAAAADPSAVVALSPNSPLPAGTNVLGNVATSAPLKATFSAAVNALVPAATPTDVFTITGSATKTVKIHKIQIDATATAAAVIACMLVKRSTANTVGTSTAPTRVPLDSTNAAVTATVLAYTANPTTGTLVGNIRSEKLFVSTAATQGETLRMEFGDSLGQPIVLRGITEVLALNLNSVTLTGGSLNCFVEWTEE